MLLIIKSAVKITMRHHVTPVRMVIICGKRQTRNKACWQGCGEVGTLAFCWWEHKIVQLLQKTVWALQKIKHKTTIRFSNPTSRYLPKLLKSES